MKRLKTFTRALCLALLLSSVAAAQEKSDATERARQYEPLILAAAARYAIDARVLWTIAFLESKFQPQAVSGAGARGMMQFTPETARRYDLRDPHDPAQSIDAAARYVRDLIGLFDNRLDLVLAAYNAGEGTVAAFRAGRQLVLSNGKIINPRGVKSEIPPYRETVAYVRSGVDIFGQLTGATYFSRLHPARPMETGAAAMSITVDLEEMPEDVVKLKQGAVYEIEDADGDPVLPKNSSTTSTYAHQ